MGKIRKKYHAGGHLPLPKSKAVKMETQALMALRALRGGFFSQDLGLDLSIFLTTFETLPLSEEESAQFHLPALLAMSNIAKRHTRTGVWGASGDDLVTLDRCLPWLAAKWVTFPRGLIADAQHRAEGIYHRVLTNP